MAQPNTAVLNDNQSQSHLKHLIIKNIAVLQPMVMNGCQICGLFNKKSKTKNSTDLYSEDVCYGLCEEC